MNQGVWKQLGVIGLGVGASLAANLAIQQVVSKALESQQKKQIAKEVHLGSGDNDCALMAICYFSEVRKKAEGGEPEGMFTKLKNAVLDAPSCRVFSLFNIPVDEEEKKEKKEKDKQKKKKGVITRKTKEEGERKMRQVILIFDADSDTKVEDIELDSSKLDTTFTPKLHNYALTPDQLEIRRVKKVFAATGELESAKYQMSFPGIISQNNFLMKVPNAKQPEQRKLIEWLDAKSSPNREKERETISKKGKAVIAPLMESPVLSRNKEIVLDEEREREKERIREVESEREKRREREREFGEERVELPTLSQLHISNTPISEPPITQSITNTPISTTTLPTSTSTTTTTTTFVSKDNEAPLSFLSSLPLDNSTSYFQSIEPALFTPTSEIPSLITPTTPLTTTTTSTISPSSSTSSITSPIPLLITPTTPLSSIPTSHYSSTHQPITKLDQPSNVFLNQPEHEVSLAPSVTGDLHSKVTPVAASSAQPHVEKENLLHFNVVLKKGPHGNHVVDFQMDRGRK